MATENNGHYLQIHYGVGTSAGQGMLDGIEVPVVMMHFAKDEEVTRRLDAGIDEFDPTDTEKWVTMGVTVHAARELIKDLQEMIEEAIQGPPDEDPEDNAGEEWKNN